MTSTATRTAGLNWPLMKNNIAREDLDAVCELLRQEDPILTQSKNVRAFEEEWSRWLGVQYSVFVNSGSSANLVTLAALKELHDAGGEIIVPAITWVSDISAVLHCGFTPVFVDINPRTLGMDNRLILDKITDKTRAVFLTHVLGYNGLSQPLLDELKRRNIPLIEDVCESHGATFNNQKLGSIGWASNFSFYYAHHLSTIEGGMVCTNDADLYETVRMMRGHGMVREMDCNGRKFDMIDEHPHPRYMHGAATTCNADVFAYAACQVKKCLEVTLELGGENYVFWGGREGYQNLLGTDMKRELDHLGRFFHMAVDYAKQIGFKGTFLIEPKPKEPTKHQYDSDAAACLNFLRQYDLMKHFKLNIETNHATLAGHTMMHELDYAGAQGALGSIDANTGDLMLGWDTDQFPTNYYLTAEIMWMILKHGGIGSGGVNFDAKVRRESFEPIDLFHAHIGGRPQQQRQTGQEPAGSADRTLRIFQQRPTKI